MAIKFRVLAKTSDTYRTVTVSDDGSEVSCDCGGFHDGLCSHIDAVLVANERAMVPLEDVAIADRAQLVTAGKIIIPDGWKRTWQRVRWWRGLTPSRPAINPRTSGNPLVCFTGKFAGADRETLKAEAQAHGWDTTDEPSRFTTVLVAADPSKNSAKLKLARKFHTPIACPDDWPEIMLHGVLPPDA